MNKFETGLLETYPQAGIDRLKVAVEQATDPIDIVNAFYCTPSLDIPHPHPYWERRVCAISQMIVDARKYYGDTEDA